MIKEQFTHKQSKFFLRLTIPTTPTWNLPQPLPTTPFSPLLQVMLHKMLLITRSSECAVKGDFQMDQCHLI